MKKLLARLKKLFASAKGFTLIELLVVIAIIGVLLGGTIVAINPADRINAAKDANGKAAVDQLSTALQSYYTVNQTYPDVLSDLEGTTSELRVLPNNPYTNTKFGATNYAINPSSCTGVAGSSACTDVSVFFQLSKTDNTSTGCTTTACAGWCWRSSQGKAGPVLAANSTSCPAN